MGVGVRNWPATLYFLRCVERFGEIWLTSWGGIVEWWVVGVCGPGRFIGLKACWNVIGKCWMSEGPPPWTFRDGVMRYLQEKL